MMYGLEKSDSAIVATKPANKAAQAAAERVEPRAGTKGNTGQPHTRRTQSRASVSQGLDRVRHAARQRKKEKFTALLHHVTIDRLRDAFLALKRHAAPGVDGVTWQDWEASLEGNLQELHSRVHRGAHRELPVRRRFIPKSGGKQRPLGNAALEADARRFWDAMRTRFEQFSLELHGEKTRLLEFGRFAAARRQRRGLGKPQTFTFLGFTFICGKSRRGAFQLQRKTRGDRMRAKLREVKQQLRRRMHQAIPEQGRWLRAVVTGFFAYHAVPTNVRALGAFRHHVTVLWRRTLRRRSQKAGSTVHRMGRIAAEWLPTPRILHPWPEQRFAVKHPR